MDRKTYHWCVVPQCRNTSIATPKKVFIKVPTKAEIRRKWLQLAGREDASKISTNTSIFICEDHFDLPNDMENFMEYQLMGSVKRIIMKPGCNPSKFDCQPDRKKCLATSENTFRSALIQEAESSTHLLKESTIQDSSADRQRKYLIQNVESSTHMLKESTVQDCSSSKSENIIALQNISEDKAVQGCAVPYCTSNSIRTPEKLFIYVPHIENIRKKWLQLAQKNPTHISTKSTLYFCEDHFDLPNDMQNYIEYKVMGSVRKVLMKPGSLPSKFVCQLDLRKRASTATSKTSTERVKKYGERMQVLKPIKVPETGKTSAERGKEYRKRQRALKPVKVPKTSVERTREWRARIADRILASQLLPSPLKREQSANKTVLQCQSNEIKQTNVEKSETVDDCQIVKISCEQTSSVTCEKRNNGKFAKQLTVKCLKTIDDCANRFIEKDNVQNVRDNKVILEIVDANHVLSSIHDLTDNYSAVIEQIIDKNDVQTHILLYKQDASEQLNNETNPSKSQETDVIETILPDVEQENLKNEWTVDSEIDICEFNIKMEQSETDGTNIKLESGVEEAFLPHIKQEQVDECSFEQGHEEMKFEESSQNLYPIFDAIKVEPEEGTNELCLSQVRYNVL